EADGLGQLTAFPLPRPERLDEGDGAGNLAGLGHEHPDGLHGRGAGADVDDPLALREPFAEAGQRGLQEGVYGLVVGGVVAAPDAGVDGETRVALLDLAGEVVEDLALGALAGAGLLVTVAGEEDDVLDLAAVGGGVVEEEAEGGAEDARPVSQLLVGVV